jgi:multidrug resistance protein MdtO
MASPVAKTMRRRTTELSRLLLPVPGRLEFSVRLALICALTALITEIYQTPEPALTVYVAFFLIKPDRVASIIISLAFLVVLSVTLLIVLVATIAVVDQPVWRIGAMTLLSFGLMFLASASKLRPVAPIVALIAAYALDLLGTIQNGEIATRGLLYAWLFVGIPAGLSILVNLLGGPAPRRLAERSLAHRLRLAAGLLRDPVPSARHEFQAVLQEGIGEILTWLKFAGIEKTSLPSDLAALRQAACSTLRIMLLVDVASRSPTPLLSPSTLTLLSEKLEAMAAILAVGTHPVEIGPLPNEPEATVEAAAWWAEMQDVLADFAVPKPDGPSAASPKAPSSFLAADAFTNPVHVDHALKTTGAAMFCYILYSLLDWPTIHTCLITCYIVALSTAAEVVEKLVLRIIGCLLGACAGIAGIVFLIPHLTSIGALMATVFLAALASAWVAGGDKRIAYAGFQIAFAFFLCVLQGNGPSFDMATARDRIIGILLGNIVVYLVFTTIWPVSVASRIDPAIAALLRTWGDLLRAGRETTAPDASRALIALGTLQRDMDLVVYEPHGLRPSAGWLDRRRQAMGHLAVLPGLFWLTARAAPDLLRDTAARLDRIADTVGKPIEPVTPTPETEPPSPISNSSDGLRRQIDTGLRSLEDVLDDHAEHRTVLVHATA